MVEKKLHIRPKKLIARKGREYYGRTIRFTKEQDDWLSEQEDVQAVFRKYVDKLMNEESLEEAAKLRERAEFLTYKRSYFSDQIGDNRETLAGHPEYSAKFKKEVEEETEQMIKQIDPLNDEIGQLEKKYKEIEEKAKVAAERRELAALTPEEKQKLDEEKRKKREEFFKEVYGDKKEKTQEEKEKEAEERLREVLSDSETEASKTDNSENENP